MAGVQAAIVHSAHRSKIQQKQKHKKYIASELTAKLLANNL